MSLWRMIFCEIAHHRVSFLLGVAAIAFAVFGFVAAIGSLSDFDHETEARMESMNAESRKQLTAHEDIIRKTMKGMGFNIHIYPGSQDLGEVYSRGFGSATMPETYVKTLADSPIVTVNHLLPRLTQMIEWTEKNRTVLLFGVSGQVPIAFRGADEKKPIMEPVSEGKIVLGAELRGELKVGDKVTFRGKEFEVAELHEPRGGVDDITVWISLETVQEMLGKPGQINSILALECNCDSLDRLGDIEKEIGAILLGVKIVEVQGKALARAKTRNEAKTLREREVANFVSSRDDLRGQREGFSSALALLVAGLSLAWVAYLTLTNVRERTVEIGTLSAIGVGAGKLLALVLARAFLMGLAGSLLAVAVALFVWKGSLTPAEWLGILITAPVLACAAAWLPAWIGSERDPATVLRND